MAIDPYYARVYAVISLTYFIEWICQIWDYWQVNTKKFSSGHKSPMKYKEYDRIGTALLGKPYLYKNGDVFV